MTATRETMGPHHQGGHANSALKDVAFLSAERSGGIQLMHRRGTVIAAKPKQRVLLHAELAQRIAQATDLGIHRRNGTKPMLLTHRQVGIGGARSGPAATGVCGVTNQITAKKG